MKSTKRLRSAIHSIGHHSISGLCYLHPYLGKECFKKGFNTIEVELLKKVIKPNLDPLLEPIELTVEALRIKFLEILKNENINSSEVVSLKLNFTFFNDHYPNKCLVRVTTKERKELEVEVSH